MSIFVYSGNLIVGLAAKLPLIEDTLDYPRRPAMDSSRRNQDAGGGSRTARPVHEKPVLDEGPLQRDQLIRQTPAIHLNP